MKYPKVAGVCAANYGNIFIRFVRRNIEDKYKSFLWHQNTICFLLCLFNSCDVVNLSTSKHNYWGTANPLKIQNLKSVGILKYSTPNIVGIWNNLANCCLLPGLELCIIRNLHNPNTCLWNVWISAISVWVVIEVISNSRSTELQTKKLIKCFLDWCYLCVGGNIC